jgi:hypothetical protein
MSRQTYECIRIQKLAAEACQTLREDMADKVTGKIRATPTTAKTLLDLTKAFDMASDRLRILKGIPMPGSLNPQRKVKRLAPTVAFPVVEGEQGEQSAGNL